jgi:hypothetical protein
MTNTVEESNKSLVLEGFDTLFNKRKARARLSVSASSPLASAPASPQSPPPRNA